MPVAGRRKVEISSANRLGNQRDAMRSRSQAGEFSTVTHAGHQAIETSENEPIDVAEGKVLRRLTPKHLDLTAKNEDFGLQRCAGPEQPGHKAPTNLRGSTIALNITRFAATGQPSLGLR
jgi:hypothetical protein